MDTLVERVAGIDVGKKALTCCVRVPDGNGGRCTETRTFRTMTRSLGLLRDWLVESGVTLAAMESTATYWKPVVRHEALWNRVEVEGLHRRAVAAVR